MVTHPLFAQTRSRSAWLGLLVTFVLLAGFISPAFAQNYQFAVPRADIVVFVNDDGTVDLDYSYTFANQPGAHEIDFVDIGVPLGSRYSLSDVAADVNGQPLSDIEESPYVNGIAVGLGSAAIQPGQTGTLHVTIANIRNLIYAADDQDGVPYASTQFQPNYFDSQFVRGETDMAVTLVLPPGLTEEEPRYLPPQNWPGETAPGAGYTNDDRVFYTWEAANASSAREYIFGASFPARVLPEGILQKPIEEGPGQPSGGATITFNDTLCPLAICGGIGLLGAVIIYFGVQAERKRKLQYLPPKIAVEGHGIKRGLTAVEAAILMERPMDKILTMILFSTLRKNAAEVVTREPLEIKVEKTLPEGLLPYERDFLAAFETTDKRKRREKLQDVMTGLVASVTQKMKGFSRKETIDYYDDIIKRAWEQVEGAETPEVKGDTFEEVMPWTMLDRGYEERTRGAFGTGPVFVPTWWWRFDPNLRPGFPGGGTATGGGVSTASYPTAGAGGGSRTIQLPNLPGADFAASMVNGVQNFASGVVGDLTAFTGGVTSRTNPPPKPTTSYRGPGGGGGGGRSCACACACAGCACACAGGGR